MASTTVKKLPEDMISVVDITSLRDSSDPVSVAKKLHAASSGLGFIYIKGHGIPDEVINRARNCAYDFFRSPKKQKLSVSISQEHRGWIGTGGAKMDDHIKTDLKESFLWGFENAHLNDHPLRGQNQWPITQPEMEQATLNYFSCVHDVAHHLMKGFAMGLSLDEDFFLKTSDVPLSRGSYVYYPNQPEELGDDQFGVGPHTDFGVLTILAQDDVGGLQIQKINGEWIEAQPIEGTLIINVADLLHRWTNGSFKSTPHRVVNRSGRERLSLVLAFDPNPETVIDAHDVFGANYSTNEPPITCGDYLTWRFDRAFSYRKNKSNE